MPMVVKAAAAPQASAKAPAAPVTVPPVAAAAIGATVPVVWSSSAGVPAVRDPEAVLRLHRLRFVERRGNDAVQELIDERRKAGHLEVARQTRDHFEHTRRLREQNDERVKRAATDGSHSYHSKEHRERIEALKQEADEAQRRSARDFQERRQTHREDHAAMTQRVGAAPVMNIRTKEEIDRIEEARLDPQEAWAKKTQEMKEVKQQYLENRAAMSARLAVMPKISRWTKAESERIEDARRDHEEGSHQRAQEMRDAEGARVEEVSGITVKASAAAGMSRRSKENRDYIEEVRQDPEEAQAAARRRAREVRPQLHQEQAAGIRERVKASPRKTFWTKEEQERIAQLRKDPEEAREVALQRMRAHALAYSDQKQAWLQPSPRQFVMDPHIREQQRIAAELLKNRRVFQQTA